MYEQFELSETLHIRYIVSVTIVSVCEFECDVVCACVCARMTYVVYGVRMGVCIYVYVCVGVCVCVFVCGCVRDRDNILYTILDNTSIIFMFYYLCIIIYIYI